MNTAAGMRGFTLVELMVIVVLLGIVASIAMPNFAQFIRNNQVQAQADEIAGFLQFARSQAVSRRESYTVDMDDWKVYPAADTTKVERKLEIDTTRLSVRRNVSGKEITFTPQGMVTVPVKLIVCSDNEHKSGYLLDVIASGMLKRYPRGRKDDNNPLTSCTTF